MPLNAVRFGAKREVKWCQNAVRFGAKCSAKCRWMRDEKHKYPL